MLRWRFAAALGLAGMIGAGAAAHRVAPDAILASNYKLALAEAETSWTSLSPNIWLSRLGSSGPERTLAAGDTITIAAKDGRPQVIEITGLEPIDGDLVGVPGVRFQFVSGRAIGTAGPPVRFLFATETPPQTPLPARSDRVL